MRKIFNKYILTTTTILISGVVAYGIVYAQQVCCNTIVNTCIQASDRIPGGYTSGSSWTTSRSQHRNIQLQSNLCSKNIPGDFGAENTCCQTDRCDSNNQATYFSLSFVQGFYPLQKNASFFDPGYGAQTAFDPDSLSTFLKTLPVYLITQSIIC
jgi:hypothetical protein